MRTRKASHVVGEKWLAFLSILVVLFLIAGKGLPFSRDEELQGFHDVTYTKNSVRS